nr:MAG TPA: hypothetical protein [Caudoviricetes sp.]
MLFAPSGVRIEMLFPLCASIGLSARLCGLFYARRQ